MMEVAAYPIPGFAEPFSSLSHLGGALVFAWLAFFLVRRGRDTGSVVSLGIFAFSSVFLLAMSGVYHLLSPVSAARAVLVRLDHAAIFVLIAGTFTPIHVILFSGWQRWGMLALIWVAAIMALVLKTVFFSGFPDTLGVALYLGLGWLGALSGFALWRRFGISFVSPLLWGAFAYTIGPAIESVSAAVLIPGVIGPHEFFHVAVLIGLGFHWRFIYRLADRRRFEADDAPLAYRYVDPAP